MDLPLAKKPTVSVQWVSSGLGNRLHEDVIDV